MTESFQLLLIKVSLSLVLSGFIGFERELRQKVAGLRTHILVGVGSTLIVLTSIHIFAIYKEVTIVDPTRMIAGIVTGIGFLCAGAIIRAGDQIKGLTTAATLWIVSGVGIAVGAGDFSSAIVVSIAVFIVLFFVRSIEISIAKKLINKEPLK